MREQRYPLLAAADIIAEPILRIDQAFADPQIISRGLRLGLPHPVGGIVPAIASPMRFLGRDYIRYERPPMLGEHPDAVLSETLGLNACDPITDAVFSPERRLHRAAPTTRAIAARQLLCAVTHEVLNVGSMQC